MDDYANLSPLNKIPTGVEGFEHLTKGGLIENRTTLLVGSSGSGKTLFSTEIVYRGATEFDRAAVFVTYPERRQRAIR